MVKGGAAAVLVGEVAVVMATVVAVVFVVTHGHSLTFSWPRLPPTQRLVVPHGVAQRLVSV